MNEVLCSVLALFLAASSAGCAEDTAPSERRDVTPVEWYPAGFSDEGRMVRIIYTMSGVASDCERPDGVEVEEEEERVRIIASKSVATDDRPCTEELAYHEEKVALAEPQWNKALAGCEPPRDWEDEACRSIQRSREAGIPDIDARSFWPPGRTEETETEWFLASFDDGGYVLNIEYGIGGYASNCEGPLEAEVDEAFERVIVTARKWAVTELGPDEACTANLFIQQEAVRLTSPIGGRPLVGCRPGQHDPSEDEICRDHRGGP